ncbi:unnamed protein product, partial [Symbiodinium microadriaticum]
MTQTIAVQPLISNGRDRLFAPTKFIDGPVHSKALTSLLKQYSARGRTISRAQEMEAMYEAKLKEAETKTLTMEAMGEAKLEALKAECHSKMRKTKQDYKQKMSHKLRERNTTYSKKMENMSAAHNSYKGKVMKSVELWRRALSTKDDKILQLQLQLNLQKERADSEAKDAKHEDQAK